MIRLYIIGVSILVIAIFANALALKLEIKTWYDFLKTLTVKGTAAFSTLEFIDYIWLFVGYPLVLGLAYRLGDKLYKLIL
jgi:hypothetical protein